MNILCDLHHEQLYDSIMRLAFRLEAELYRPKGIEWFHEGIWCINDAEDTALQYLGEYTYESFPGVTLSEAKAIDWDIIITSHIYHFLPFEKFRVDQCPTAKHVFQVGNNWELDQQAFSGLKNVLNASSSVIPPGVNSVTYHPEFERPSSRPPKVVKRIVAMMHYPHEDAIRIGKELAGALSWPVEFYGSGNGTTIPMRSVPWKMQESGFLLHHKPEGDGYGFNVHQALAAGRPVIINHSDFLDKLAAPMLTAQTSICSEQSIDRMAHSLRLMAADHARFANHTRTVWSNHANPDWEFHNLIVPFLQRLK